MKKSRYQMTNRGRKGKPNWYIEDFKGLEGQSVGKYVTSYKTRGQAASYLSWLRAFAETEGVKSYA